MICPKCDSKKVSNLNDVIYHDAYRCENCGFIKYVKTEYCCKTPNTVYTFQYINGIAKFIREQCLNCGGCENMTKPLSFKKFSHLVKGEFNRDRLDEYKNSKKEEQNQLYKNNTWFVDYGTYLKSDIWKEKRIKILRRDKYICQKCFKNNATDIHHLTYKNFGFEKLDELLALCRLCHEELHAK